MAQGRRKVRDDFDKLLTFYDSSRALAAPEDVQPDRDHASRLVRLRTRVTKAPCLEPRAGDGVQADPGRAGPLAGGQRAGTWSHWVRAGAVFHRGLLVEGQEAAA